MSRHTKRVVILFSLLVSISLLTINSYGQGGAAVKQPPTNSSATTAAKKRAGSTPSSRKTNRSGNKGNQGGVLLVFNPSQTISGTSKEGDHISVVRFDPPLPERAPLRLENGSMFCAYFDYSSKQSNRDVLVSIGGFSIGDFHKGEGFIDDIIKPENPSNENKICLRGDADGVLLTNRIDIQLIRTEREIDKELLTLRVNLKR